MMKEFIRQFYNEGLATTFYKKPVKYLEENISNEIVLKIALILLKIDYTLLVLLFAYYMFKRKWPL